MTGKGFTIRQLLVTGDNVDRASVEFAPGLNVVAYMSQTGKSYLLECIDFMLGGKTPPRNIHESRGYDTVWMEILDAAGQVYVLQRPLAGGAFRLYRLALADIKSDSPSTRLSTTHSAKTSASKFFLGLAGFPIDAELKNNAANAKSSMSFRTISHFFIVDEISMIDDPSPIQTRQGFAVTIERSAFKLLLTGQDDSQLEEQETVTVEQVADRVRREVYDELIGQLDAELVQLRGQATPALGELDALIAATSSEVEATSARIREQESARRDNWLATLEADSRLLVLNELLSRFRLLRSHYDSDLQRLEFIGEGKHYLDQLETIACPLCGSALDESPDGDGELTVASVEAAHTREAEKIRTHIGDLEGTVGVLQSEHSEVTARAATLRDRVMEIDHLLSATLAPQMAAVKRQVEELIHQRSQLLYTQTLEVRLATIKEVRAGMGEPVDEPEEEEPTESRVQIDDQAITDFCDTMRSLLERWHYLPASSQVVFDTAKFDFVVGGQARRNNGKGVRAIIHAAFNIALMRYCLAKNLAHPRVVLLDSPLTTFKERGQPRPANVDEVPGEVQIAFFEDLAKVQANEQIIVIENKQPPPGATKGLNYIKFLGDALPGRTGFFPAARAST